MIANYEPSFLFECVALLLVYGGALGFELADVLNLSCPFHIGLMMRVVSRSRAAGMKFEQTPSDEAFRRTTGRLNLQNRTRHRGHKILPR